MRDLPWRRSGPPGARDPYHSLLSELMLQQTQVARVIDKFILFVDRFPTLAHLAAAPVEVVLALWSGLGYYRRARLLHAAARAIVNDHAGVVPRDIATLRTIPGIGPYTAGAIASMAHGERTPLVDGNVVRVLLRLSARDGRVSDKTTMDWTWQRTTELVQLANRPGVFNEALMELGATVCTPKSPHCESCPLATDCLANARGLQDQIPRPKAKPKRRPIAQACIILRDTRGRVLLEERSHTGLWAGLWQPITCSPTTDAKITEDSAIQDTLRELGLDPASTNLNRIGSFDFHTSHREVRFGIYECTSPLRTKPAKYAQSSALPSAVVRRRWVTPSQISTLALSNAHRDVLVRAGVLPRA